MTNRPTAVTDLGRALGVVKVLFAVFSLAVVALLLLVWGDSSTRVDDLEQLLDQQADDRLQGQLSACNGYNQDLAASVNRLIDENIEFVAFLGEDLTPETPRAPEEQEAVDRAVRSRQQEYEAARLRYRDCTARGLESYSEGEGGYLAPGSALPEVVELPQAAG